MGVAKSRQTYFQSHSAIPSKVASPQHIPTNPLICRNTATYCLTSQVHRRGTEKCPIKPGCWGLTLRECYFRSKSFNNYDIKNKSNTYFFYVFPLILYHVKIETENIIKTAKQPALLSQDTIPVSQVHASELLRLEWKCCSIILTCSKSNSPCQPSASHTTTAEGFSLYCDYKSSSGAVGVFYRPILCPHSLGWATAQQTIERELSGQSMAGAGGIVPPSIGITEQITGVCIFAVFGGGPTFAVMNRSLVFFVGVEGQWQPSLRRACWRRRRESN